MIKDLRFKIWDLGFGILICAFLCFCSSLLVFSQDEIDLGEIVVTATKTEHLLKDIPVNSNVITKNEIDSIKSINLNEPLRLISSLNVSNYGGLGSSNSIMIRGTTGKHTLFLIDGIPINNPQSGEIDFGSIPVSNIEKVEIVKGPTSSLYGANALGGVVNIITRSGSKKNPVMLNQEVGPYGANITRITVQGENKNLDYFLTNDAQMSDGFRINSKYESENNTVKIGFKNLNMYYIKNTSERGTPGPSQQNNPVAKQNDTRENIGINYKFQKNKKQTIFKFYKNNFHTEYIDPSFFIHSAHKNYVSGLEVQQIFNISDNLLLTYGYEYKGDKVRSTDVGEHKTGNRGFYLQSEIKPNKKIILLLGDRYDRHSVYKNKNSIRIGGVCNFNEDMRAKISFGEGFRAPNFDDLYSPTFDFPDLNWGYATFGNQNLKPERSNSLDFGFEKEYKNTNFKLSYFKKNIKDLIEWIPTYAPLYPNGIWTPKNAEKAEIEGVEVELNNKINKNFSSSINYTYLNAKDKNTNKYLIYRPKNQTNCRLNYRYEKFLVNFIFNFKNESYSDKSNTKVVEGYSISNINLTYDVTLNQQFYIKINNLFNKTYEERSSYPMPKRNIYYGLNIKF